MKRSAHGAAIALGIFLLICAAAPAAAEASTVTVGTAQVLPPGGTSCAPLKVQSVVPYLQNGELQSFDVVIADPTYVGIQATVGERAVTFNYMSRWHNQDGTIKIHVDVQSTPVLGTVPVTVTLLSSPASQPTCLATISFGVEGGNAPMQGTGGTSGTQGTGSNAHGSSTTPVVVKGSGNPVVSSSSTSTATSSHAVGSAIQSNLERACAASGSYQLWFVLLALFVVIVTIVAIAQPPLADRSPALPLTAILIPLVLLIAFWYFAPLCRAASWIPVILIIAAILGLVVAFRDRGVVGNVIQLPPAKTK